MSDTGTAAANATATPAPSSSLLPQIPPDATISFEDAHRPSLPAGDYSVAVTQRLGDLDYSAGATADFQVSGPRFALAPSDIGSVYPPDGSRGRFDSSLPHVVLERSTLPWERTSLRGEHSPEPPWLGLVVIDANDEVVATMTVAEVRAAASGPPQFPGLASELSDDAQAAVRVVTVPVDRLPAGEDLDLTCHVRAVMVDGKRSERAVVVATYVPLPGRRSTVHLVSLEGLYEPGSGHDHRLWDGHDPTGSVRLVSLFSWAFTCQEHDRHGFAELAKGLEQRTAMLRPDGSVDSQTPRESGFAALEHQLRTGAAMTSWYHGPLLPAAPPGPALDLPAGRADDLLLFDESTGMLDVSYASAWELGRTLSLQSEPVSTNLHAWKRWEAHDERRAAEAAEMSHVPHYHASPAPPIDFTGGPWFTERLIRLGGVPFRYLVADDAALPEESFRFFRIDRRWVEALVDGAFSIGRTSDADIDRDRERYDRTPQLIPQPTDTVTGFLLRSELVSGYPGLLVEAFDAALTAGPHGIDLTTATGRVDHLRLDHLAPNVLFGLYDGRIHTVAVHLHPQVLHFGFADGEVTPGPISLRHHDTVGEHAGSFAAALVAKAPLALFSIGTDPQEQPA